MRTEPLTLDDYTIHRDPARCGGDPTVGPTRICVHNIVAHLRLYGGDRAAMDAAGEYDHYAPEIVDAALSYYEGHRAEIDEIIARMHAAYDSLVCAGLTAREIEAPVADGPRD